MAFGQGSAKEGSQSRLMVVDFDAELSETQEVSCGHFE